MRGWMWLAVGEQRYLVFGYVDGQAGPSAKGAAVSDPPTADQLSGLAHPSTTFRMPMGEATALSAEETAALGLPAEPEWMEFFRSAPTAWASDPRLEAAFHPSHPNDLQAMFFMPLSGTVESMWVKLRDVDPPVDGYRGVLLNDAHGDPSLRSGLEVTVRPTAGVSQPVWVSEVVRDNFARYRGACAECGFDLVLVPVDALIESSFPGVPADHALEAFTTRCAICSGTQVLQGVRQ